MIGGNIIRLRENRMWFDSWTLRKTRVGSRSSQLLMHLTAQPSPAV